MWFLRAKIRELLPTFVRIKAMAAAVNMIIAALHTGVRCYIKMFDEIQQKHI